MKKKKALKKNYFCIYLFLAVLGLRYLHRLFLQLQRVGAPLQFQCTGFPLRWLLLLQSRGFRAPGLSAPCVQGTGSTVVAHRLGCSTDPPRSGIEPVSPALAGRFLSPEPPGKALKQYFLKSKSDYTGKKSTVCESNLVWGLSEWAWLKKQAVMTPAFANTGQ